MILERTARVLTIRDELSGGCEGPIPARLAFHLGPSVVCRLELGCANLSWPGGGGELELPALLKWTLHCGQENPPLGWFSPSFNVKIPSVTLVGESLVKKNFPLVCRLRIR